MSWIVNGETITSQRSTAQAKPEGKPEGKNYEDIRDSIRAEWKPEKRSAKK
jgi:hypothetical protein